MTEPAHDVTGRAPQPAAPGGQRTIASPQELRSKDIFRLIVLIWPFIRPYKRHLFYLFLTILPALPAGLFVIYMTRVFFDVVGHGEALTPVEAWMLQVPIGSPRELVLWRASLVSGLAILVSMPLGFFIFGYGVWILQRISNLFRVSLYARLQELSLRFHSDEKIGDAIFRMFQDSAAIPQVISGLVIWPLRWIPMAVADLVWLVMFNYAMALIAILLIPANLLIAWWFSPILRERFVIEREATADATTRIEETLASIKAVKAFGTEAGESSTYARDNWMAFIAARRARLTLAGYRVCTNVVRALAYVGALYFGAEQVLAGGNTGLARAAISLGLFQGALGAFAVSGARMRSLTDRWGSMQDVGVAVSRVFEMLGRPAEEKVHSGSNLPSPSPKVLTFEDLSFGYDPGSPVLSGVSFEARAGELTAIAGPSGAGKSTIIGLAIRFFNPSAGRILLDGRPIAEFDLNAYRGLIAVALQENPLFTATIRDNIAYGRPEAPLAEILAAAARAGLGDFVRSLPEGFDTVLGEKGAKLSAGQAQRIGLARALLRNAPILLLDEPTSALDHATEQIVMRGLRQWIQEQPHRRMVLIATHRRTTAACADRTYYLSDGLLSETGGSAARRPVAAGVQDG